jgi:adenylate cyclase
VKPRTARRLRSAAFITAVFFAVSLTWDFVTTGGVTPPAFILGVLIGLPLIILEQTSFAEKTRALPFTASLLVKTVTYVGVLSFVFLGVGFVSGAIRGLRVADFVADLPDMFLMVGVAFVLYLVIIFFLQLDRLLGPGVLWGYLTGRYHRPRVESRVFMFVDLKGSTELGERLSQEDYYGLLNDFFRDVSGPVLDARGEIYEYVGDEVVLTWKLPLGLQNAHCLRVFFDIDRAVQANALKYVHRYGLVPEFKAGAHAGEVIAAEIGDLKKGIVFSGDVLNTAARIQGECNRLDRRFLVSRTLMEQLQLPEALLSDSVGSVALRGKAAPVELVAVTQPVSGPAVDIG